MSIVESPENRLAATPASTWHHLRQSKEAIHHAGQSRIGRHDDNVEQGRSPRGSPRPPGADGLSCCSQRTRARCLASFFSDRTSSIEGSGGFSPEPRWPAIGTLAGQAPAYDGMRPYDVARRVWHR
jgi:hypothetical protein